ncbi:hypothetical protein EVAR_98534_1 [Eumeta japonica]|uniref:Uncharacterized protein n=1 Tax=Eumeta variegata TaxID=151549 RepID=A0A4C1YMW2_EUMVA|nr:hypothetical protein EVAR_98534_1 [Eumeta japonica]
MLKSNIYYVPSQHRRLFGIFQKFWARGAYTPSASKTETKGDRPFGKRRGLAAAPVSLTSAARMTADGAFAQRACAYLINTISKL